MGINSRSLVNLLLLLVLLAVFLIFSAEDDSQASVEHLTQLQPDEINLIRIPRDNNNDIVIKKITDASGNKIWQMKNPT
jgi:hypothetical protein